MSHVLDHGNVQAHEISDTTGNIQKMSCVLVKEMYLKCEIYDVPGNVQEMSNVLVLKIYKKCKISIS